MKLHCFGGLFWLDFVQVFQLLCRDFLSLFEAILAPCYWLVLCPTSWTLASLFYTTLEALSLVLSCWKLRHFSGFIALLFWTVWKNIYCLFWILLAGGLCFVLQGPFLPLELLCGCLAPFSFLHSFIHSPTCHHLACAFALHYILHCFALHET